MTDDRREVLARSATKYIAEVDPTELACRMLEAAQNMRRPLGTTAKEALDSLDQDSREWLMRQAIAALTYMSECFASAGRVS